MDNMTVNSPSTTSLRSVTAPSSAIRSISSTESLPRNNVVVNSLGLINPDDLQLEHTSSDTESEVVTSDYGTDVNSVTPVSEQTPDDHTPTLLPPAGYTASGIETPLLRGIQSRIALQHDETSIQHAFIAEEPVPPILNDSAFRWAFFNGPTTMNFAGMLLLAGGLFALSLGLAAFSTPLATVGAVVAGAGALLGLFGKFSGFVAQSASEERAQHQMALS